MAIGETMYLLLEDADGNRSAFFDHFGFSLTPFAILRLKATFTSDGSTQKCILSGLVRFPHDD